MAKIKLTKTIVDAAKAGAQDVELRDTLVPGFLCKVTPTGRKVFMVQYRTNAGERRKPAIGLFGELTIEQARSIAQDWLAEVRRGHDPCALKAAARQAPTVKELCVRFIEDYSKPHNKPSTVASNRKYISLHIGPALGSMKVPDVTRQEVVALMKKREKAPTGANRVLACLRKMFNMAEVWGYGKGNSKAAPHLPHWFNGKRSAQVQRAGGVRDQSRMTVTRHEARSNAREPDGGTPGRSERITRRSNKIRCTVNIAISLNIR